MTGDKDFFNNENYSQFTISYELLCLLRWLIEHNTEDMKNMITYAIQMGLNRELQKIDTTNLNLATSGMRDTIGDFVKVLELLLLEAMDDEMMRKAKLKKLMTDINKIDTNLCDSDTVRISLEKTTNSLDKNPDANPRDQLYKEILKQWQPDKKKIYN